MAWISASFFGLAMGRKHTPAAANVKRFPLVFLDHENVIRFLWWTYCKRKTLCYIESIDAVTEPLGSGPSTAKLPTVDRETPKRFLDKNPGREAGKTKGRDLLTAERHPRGKPTGNGEAILERALRWRSTKRRKPT